MVKMKFMVQKGTILQLQSSRKNVIIFWLYICCTSTAGTVSCPSHTAHQRLGNYNQKFFHQHLVNQISYKQCHCLCNFDQNPSIGSEDIAPKNRLKGALTLKIRSWSPKSNQHNVSMQVWSKSINSFRSYV